MKKTLIVLLALFPSLGFSQAVIDRFKQKVKNRVEQRTDDGMEKMLDKTEQAIGDETKKSKTKSGKKDTVITIEKKTSAEQTSFTSYSHYDFIPGEQIVYAEDFSQDVVGEFPLKWATNNHGETQTVGGQPGKWMRMYQSGRFVSPYIKKLPENFTAEFDFILNFRPGENSWIYPELAFKLVQMPAGDEQATKYLRDFTGLTTVKVALSPEAETASSIYLRIAAAEDKEYFTSPPKDLKNFNKVFGKPVHIAIWIQKERLRIWMNGEKIYDLPHAIPANTSFNRFELEAASSNYEEEQIGYFISNIRFAQGAPDMRSKLMTEGKLVTTGILFDVNSDKIKPESFGVLQEIAKVLKENPSVKIKIIGHTDSDGDDAKNLDLSKRRAASVKQALSTQFGIEASRIETDGKGEAVPVSDNQTKEGKAQNRRVEFIKQ